jgi:hypothetical protein
MYSTTNKPKVGERVIFGRLNGEQTRGTVLKVNRVKCKVQQDESRGTMKDHAVGTIWTVPFRLLSPDPTANQPNRPVSGPEDTLMAYEAEAGESSDPIVGATVVEIRKMTKAELSMLGWDDFRGHEVPIAIVLSSGAVLFPSRDDECNGPGVIMGDHNKESFQLIAGKAGR